MRSFAFFFSCFPAELLYQKKPAFYAYIFGTLGSEKIDKEYCADVFVTPASCQKIITTLLAYSFLGVDYQYETKVYHSINSNDIIISFVGDPSITTRDLFELLEPLKRYACGGNIIIDLSFWNTDQFSPYFMGEDRGTSYCRPVLPAVINKNSIEGHCDGIEYITQQITMIAQSLDMNSQVVVVSDPLELPNEIVCVNAIRSKPLHMIIEPALKSSDNLVFDALYFTILTRYLDGRVTGWDQGDLVIKELLKRYFDIDADTARFVDGSGLSRLNKISLRTLFAILKKGYFVDKFIDALPCPGQEQTTLAQRKTLPPTLRAKTGTLGGITCLCGYNMTGEPRVFCFTAQGFPSPLNDMVSTIDQWIVEQLHEL